MNGTGILILICLGCVFFIYKRIKTFPVILIKNCIDANNYTGALEIVEKASTKKIMKPLEYDRTKLLLYFRLGKKKDFQDMIKEIGAKKYKQDNQLPLLEDWFHKCLLYEQSEFSSNFLEAIQKCGDEESKTISYYAYRVMIEKNIDDETKIQQLFNQFKTTSFHYGICAILLGKINELKEDIKNACNMYDFALVQFQTINNYIYYNYAKAYIDTYGNKNNVFYGELHTKLFNNEINMVETYRYDPNMGKKKTKHKKTSS